MKNLLSDKKSRDVARASDAVNRNWERVTRALLHVTKFFSATIGFFGAFWVVRASSSAFNWYAEWIFGSRIEIYFMPALIIFLAAMCVFGFCVWKTKRRENSFVNKIDFSIVFLICVSGFYICYLFLTSQMLTPWDIFQMQNRTVYRSISMNEIYVIVLYVPFLAYALAVFCFSEFVARVRDRNFFSTICWFSFFKMYRSSLFGCLMAILLICQFVLLVLLRNIPIILIPIATLGLLTYLAAYVINLSKVYSKANDDKIRSERFKTELITNVSHDIKTPLTSIISYVDLLKNEDLQGKSAEYLSVLDRKTARLKTLIDDLMDASKAGTGSLRVDLQEVNLLEIVGQVAGEFEENFFDAGLILVLRQPEESMFFFTDSRHLYRILENLFSNASKYALGGTRVFVEIILRDGRPHIKMQNVSASPVDFSDGEATEQFIRGDKSRHTEGSGLGLYIAKSLVELLGGKFFINVSGDLFRV
ncbi:MAG: HAMP domain-containing histidine kinase, partial [Defluviitaleaceae bacterium]|nr:HAMP domain-containing histidine kinase [Defluviitaleaceae bacterium]